MSFTDDDLKRLKDNVAKGGWSPKMLTLLSRLEAAELCIKNAPLKEGGVLNEADVRAWLKATGRRG